jgi:hypothetical protein
VFEVDHPRHPIPEPSDGEVRLRLMVVHVQPAHDTYRPISSKSLATLASTQSHLTSTPSNLQPQTITIPELQRPASLPLRLPRPLSDGDTLRPILPNSNPTHDSCAGQTAPSPCNLHPTLPPSTKSRQRHWLLANTTLLNLHLSASTTADLTEAMYGTKRAILSPTWHPLQTLHT